MKGEDTECFEEKNDPIELWLAQAPGRLKDRLEAVGIKLDLNIPWWWGHLVLLFVGCVVEVKTGKVEG